MPVTFARGAADAKSATLGRRGQAARSGKVKRLASPPTLSVKVLQQLMSGELDLFVSPLRCAVDACDQPRPMEPAEVAIDEPVPCLGLLCCSVSQAQVPLRILVP